MINLIYDLPYVAEWSRSTPQPIGHDKHCVIQYKDDATVEIELFARTGIRMLCGYIDGEWDVFPFSTILNNSTSLVVY